MRLLVWTLGLFLLMGLGVCLALNIGYSHHIAPTLNAAHLADCIMPSPCWIGIIPGKTTINEATRQILKVYDNSPNYSITILSRSPIRMIVEDLGNSATKLGPIWITIRSSEFNDTIVGSIQMRFSAGNDKIYPTISQILSIFSISPSAITRESNQILNILTFKDNDPVVVIDSTLTGSNRFDLHQQVAAIIWFENINQADMDRADIKNWRGFASLQTYGLR